jgi:hypothetical protein
MVHHGLLTTAWTHHGAGVVAFVYRSAHVVTTIIIIKRAAQARITPHQVCLREKQSRVQDERHARLQCSATGLKWCPFPLRPHNHTPTYSKPWCHASNCMKQRRLGQVPIIMIVYCYTPSLPPPGHLPPLTLSPLTACNVGSLPRIV